jgi:hypothetical protein
LEDKLARDGALSFTTAPSQGSPFRVVTQDSFVKSLEADLRQQVTQAFSLPDEPSGQKRRPGQRGM